MNRGWVARLEVGDVWNDDDLPLPAKGAQIVERITSAPWYTADDVDLFWLVDELSDAAAADHFSWFDQCWDAFYDWCDLNRVWVETMRVEAR